MEYQLSAEEVKKRLDPRLSPPSGMLGLAGQQNVLKQAPMLDQICDRLTNRNGQFREVIERIEGAMDRIQPLGTPGSDASEASKPSGVLGRIEAAVDYQDELLSRLRRAAARLETIA